MEPQSSVWLEPSQSLEANRFALRRSALRTIDDLVTRRALILSLCFVAQAIPGLAAASSEPGTLASVAAEAAPSARASLPKTRPLEGGRPHIVLIVADDLGWGDVGYQGSEIQTPRIDALAADGVRFERFYAQPTCSPTRSALMTGMMPRRLGVLRPISKNEALGLPLEWKLLPERLAEVGYQSVMAGKWHLGHVSREYFPQARGFESFYGNVTGGIGYWDHVHGGGLDWQRDGSSLREQGYSTHLVAAEAERLIASRDASKPLFLYLAFNAPHLPNEAPDETVARYEDLASEDRRLHAAMVTELDTAVGRVLDALEEAGIADDTIVWFLSDNGGIVPGSSHESLHGLLQTLEDTFGKPLRPKVLEFARVNVLDGGSDNGSLRGGKGSVWEGGARVPALVRWPGHFPVRALDSFLTVADVMPTLLEAAGLAEVSGTDGQSQLGSLKGKAKAAPHADYVTQTPGQTALYRYPWKLVVSESLLPLVGPTLSLFQVDEDPTEQRDLAAAEPERVEELLAALNAIPEAESIHGAYWPILLDPDVFGGEEDRGPWAEAAR